MIRQNLRPIENDKQFERFCCEIAKDVFGDYAAQCYGRSGQGQGGIDIRATNRRTGGGSIVIQCKYKALSSIPRIAARAILATENFVTLPHQIVSTALNIVASEEAGISAALRVLAQSEQVTTFLQFAALKTLAQLTNESMRSIVDDFVSRALNPPFHGKGALRLRHDLLYLPYARIDSHRRFTEKITKSYHPACDANLKRDIYKILRCRFEYGPQSEIAIAVNDLCKRVAQCCVADLEHQWRVNREAPQLGHIWMSLELLNPSPAYRDSVGRLQAYGTANTQVGEWHAFRNLMTRVLATLDRSLQET